MRGFAGLLVAAAFALVLFHSIALQRTVLQAESQQLQAGLKMAQLRGVEDDMRTSFQMVVFKAGGQETDARQRAKKVVLALADWEKVQEEKYGAQGIALDAWLGAISSTEKSELPVEMLEKNKPLKCAACVDLLIVSLQAQNYSAATTNLFAIETTVKKITSSNFTARTSHSFSAKKEIEVPSAGVGWSIFMEKEGIASVQTGGFGS